MLTWQFSRFDSLPIRDWYAASTLRVDVFVMEQNCPFQDNDGADFDSWHLLGWHDAIKESTVRMAAENIMKDPSERRMMARAGRALIDGRGPDRLPDRQARAWQASASHRHRGGTGIS